MERLQSAGARLPVNAVCPICGGDRFTAGPKGRLSPDGVPPRCVHCGSLERHRAFRTVFDALRPVLAARRVLQFSDDPSAPRDAFAAFEVSQYGGDNSLDLAAIDRPDGAVDMVIANHVLEHVENDLAAVAELDRVTAPGGLVFLSVPDLLRMTATVEYGRAREDKHGHYRLYGPDMILKVRRAAPQWHGVGVVARDPVTGAPDRASLFSRSAALCSEVRNLLQDAGFQPFDAFAGSFETPKATV